MDKPIVLITGGSSGFGLELAHRFAGDGHSLVLVALPGRDLEEVSAALQGRYPGVAVHALGVDLSTTRGPEEVIAFTDGLGLDIGVLINNAGFGTWGYLPNVPVERELAMLRLNIEALYRLTQAYLPRMDARGRGHIINIASIAAFQPNPYMATYGASKAFVRSFSLALAQELRDQGSAVRVTVVCPPAARTPFQAASGMVRSALFSSWLAVDAPMVADAIYRGYRRGSRQVIPGWLFQVLAVITRLLPESVSTAIAIRTLRKGVRGRGAVQE